jgi:hypothetical protein
MDELGNKDTNRNINIVDLEELLGALPKEDAQPYRPQDQHIESDVD